LLSLRVCPGSLPSPRAPAWQSILRHGHPARMETGWVGLMKGEVFPGNQGLGLVHRSPPIADTGETRVLFCLDG